MMSKKIQADRSLCHHQKHKEAYLLQLQRRIIALVKAIRQSTTLAWLTDVFL